MAVFLESERLWFRAREKSDAAFYTQALQDPRVHYNLMTSGRFPFTEAAEEQRIEKHTAMPAIDGQTDILLTFGIKGEDQLLGATGLHSISALHRNAEWGIFIGRPEEWGKGYGREVAKSMLRYGFQALNLHRIYLRVNADNESGIKAYRAAGFKDEAVSRQDVFRAGQYVDSLHMAVLREEWEATNGSSA